MTTPPQPAQQFRIGSVCLSIYENTDRHGRLFFTTSFSRVGRTSSGAKTENAAVRDCDIPVMGILADKGLNWIAANASPRPTPVAPLPSGELEPDYVHEIETLAHLIELQFTR